jgi:hypothetical protein
MQFSYSWGYAQREFTDVTIAITVTNDITNKIGGNGEVIDTYKITVGSDTLEITEKHTARTYTYTITGTQTVRLEGIDRGFWGGFYGPIMNVVVTGTPAPEPTNTPTPEPTSESASPEPTSSPDLSSTSSETSSPSTELSESPEVPSESPSPTEDPSVSPEASESETLSPTPESTSSPEPQPELPSVSEEVTESPSTEPTSSPEPSTPLPPVWDYVINEGNTLEFQAPEGMVVSGVVARYVAHDSDCGVEVSTIVATAVIGQTSGVLSSDNGTFGDPCPGWYKKLVVDFEYAQAIVTPIPVEPTPPPVLSPEEQAQQAQAETDRALQDANDWARQFEPTQSSVVTVSPEPTPIQTPEPTPDPEPTPAPEPVVPQPVEPSPETTPEPVTESVPVEPEPTPSPEPEPSPTTTPTPTPVDTPESEPTETPQPSPTPEPVPEEPEPAPTVDPTPEPRPEPKPEPAPETPEDLTSDTPIEDVVAVIENINPTTLTEEQVGVLVSIALETFETAEQGSEEYEAALDLLLVAAQADDIVLDEELAAIPLIGNVAGAAVEVFNALGNAGADMSPQVREQSEKVVIAAVIVGQVAMTAVASATSAASVAARRP